MTVKEAKQRWNEHTKKVLTPAARKAARAGKYWFPLGDKIILTLEGGEFQFRFDRDARGNISVTRI